MELSINASLRYIKIYTRKEELFLNLSIWAFSKLWKKVTKFLVSSLENKSLSS